MTAVLAVAALAQSVGIYFETNDDVSMMMLAHGFGLTNVATDQILFSNRLEGDIVDRIGMPFGQPGYSIYMFLCLSLSLGFLFASLIRLNHGVLVNAATITALAIRPLLAPQFTITASLLSLAGIVVFLDDRTMRSPCRLVAATGLFFLGFLMRIDSAVFMLLIASPMLLRARSFQRGTLVAAGAFMLAVMAALWWDGLGYLSEGWTAFNAVEGPRVWFTDYGVAAQLLDKPDLLTAAGWSRNDVDMIAQWWFVDPQVYSAERLGRLLSVAGPLTIDTVRTDLLSSWFGLLLGWDMAPLVILSVISLALSLRGGQWRLLVCVTVVLAAFAGFALLGRPGITRVAYSAFAALLVLSCLSPFSRSRTVIQTAAALICASVLAVLYVGQAQQSRLQQAGALAELHKVPPADVVVVWADVLPYQALYPAFLRAGEDFPPVHIYSLGSDQLAPHALSWWGGDAAQTIRRLTSPDGIDLVARDDLVAKLDVYCREHWGIPLAVDRSVPAQGWQYYHVACPTGSQAIVWD